MRFKMYVCNATLVSICGYVFIGKGKSLGDLNVFRPEDSRTIHKIGRPRQRLADKTINLNRETKHRM